MFALLVWIMKLSNFSFIPSIKKKILICGKILGETAAPGEKLVLCHLVQLTKDWPSL